MFSFCINYLLNSWTVSFLIHKWLFLPKQLNPIWVVGFYDAHLKLKISLYISGVRIQSICIYVNKYGRIAYGPLNISDHQHSFVCWNLPKKYNVMEFSWSEYMMHDTKSYVKKLKARLCSIYSVYIQ